MAVESVQGSQVYLKQIGTSWDFWNGGTHFFVLCQQISALEVLTGMLGISFPDRAGRLGDLKG